jgi:hypothetical protein
MGTDKSSTRRVIAMAKTASTKFSRRSTVFFFQSIKKNDLFYKYIKIIILIYWISNGLMDGNIMTDRKRRIINSTFLKVFFKINKSEIMPSTLKAG